MTQIDTDSGLVAEDFPAAATPGREFVFKTMLGRVVNAPRLISPRFTSSAYRRAFIEALRHRQFGIAGALVNSRHNCSGYFRFVKGNGIAEHQTVIRLAFRPGHCFLELSQHLTGNRLDFVSVRLLALMPLLAACQDAPDGTIALNIDDYGIVPGLAFSDGRPDRLLIPDPVYLMENAYRRTATLYAKHHVPWANRLQTAFWRGATTGGEGGCEHWEMLDRVRLCRIAADHPTLFDAGLVGVVQMNAADTAAINASGLVRNFVPEAKFIEYRYQIDIDGNTNSWPGLFQKLMTGSPVLKVASRLGHRQWYYDRLVPWENFVPVASDMSDLIEKLDWLASHDDDARRIGMAGKSLANSMTIASELQRARQTVFAGLAAASPP